MKKGMTPEAVEQMAGEISTAGQEVQQIATQAQAFVTDLDWTGEDRDRYVSDFEGTLVQMAQQVQQAAEGFSDRARNDAQQQRAASS